MRARQCKRSPECVLHYIILRIRVFYQQRIFYTLAGRPCFPSQSHSYPSTPFLHHQGGSSRVGECWQNFAAIIKENKCKAQIILPLCLHCTYTSTTFQLSWIPSSPTTQGRARRGAGKKIGRASNFEGNKKRHCPEPLLLHNQHKHHQQHPTKIEGCDQ